MESQSEEEDVVCPICSSMPCEWLEYGRQALDESKQRYNIDENGSHVEKNGALVPNSTIRRATYRLFTYKKYGHLGRGLRIPIPQCVLDKVREAFPEADGVYHGLFEE